MNHQQLDVLLTAREIEYRVAQLADEIRKDYSPSDSLHVIGVMSGVVVFLADLIRKLDLPMQLEFITASSYRGATTTAGEVVLDETSFHDVEGKHVLLVDDIFDTGRTLERIVRRLNEQQPASLKSAVLLWKTERNETGMQPDYVGFPIPDRFVVGYGLDYDGQFRNLPDIRVLNEG